MCKIVDISEDVLKAYASEQSKSIVIRTAEGYTRRDATPKEQMILFTILYGSLLCARQTGSDLQTIKENAEYIGVGFIPEMNGYDTIYTPLEKFFIDNGWYLQTERRKLV